MCAAPDVPWPTLALIKQLPMNLSILGTGKIVHEVLPVIAATDGINICSILAGPHSFDKAQALAAAYAIPRVCADYSDVLADANVDTVYVGLINSVHFDYALRTLQAGKNVILEKPVSLTLAQLQRLVDEARERHLFLFEAVTLLHLPAFHILRDELLPQLGTIRHIECNYSQRSSRYDRYLQGIITPAFDPAAGGGALMDINIYNLHFTLALLGAPIEATYVCRRGFNGVDLSGTVMLRYPNAIALCTGAKDTDAPSFGLLQGDNGWIRIDGPVSTMKSITIGLRDQAPRAISLPPVSHRLAPEFAAFVHIMGSHDFDYANSLLDHSIEVMKVIDKR